MIEMLETAIKCPQVAQEVVLLLSLLVELRGVLLLAVLVGWVWGPITKL